jgi:hypothetical protein
MFRIPSIVNVSQIEPRSLIEIVSEIRSDEAIKDLVNAIRKAPNKADRDDLKRSTLPAFTLAKVRNRIDSENFISAKYIIYDIDGLNPTELMTVRAAVQQISVFYFTSPSGMGVKFVIEMDRDMNLEEYRINRGYYRKLLSDMLGQKLDESYNSLHTFYTHDPSCQISPLYPKFPALSVDVAARADDINPAICSSEELKDVCEYISKQKLNFITWTKLAFSLKNVQGGRDLFLMIGKGDTASDHSHRNWEKKWDSCDAREINVGTLFHIADQHGYVRKYVYQQDGQGGYNPFIVNEDGMYYKPKEKKPQRIFGFSRIKIIYQIFDPDNGNKTVLRVNDSEVKLKSQVFSSAGEFRKAIQSMVKGSPFMITSSKSTGYYDMLFDYLDKTKSDLCVQSLPGIGKVSVEHNIWNFGSIVIMDGNILPWDSLIMVNGRGYALDDIRASVTIVNEPKDLRRKANLLHEVYTEHAATAIGWAVSNIFYKEILREFGAFPILFLHGNSMSGKTRLAAIIQAMFGVNASNSTSFKVNLASGATATAMSRVKDGVGGIPHFYDEYGKGARRLEHYDLLKALFDGDGKTMARKTNDNQTHRMNVNSGSIFAAVERDSRMEAITRCCYVDLTGVKSDDKDRQHEFYREFVTSGGLKNMSGFIMSAVCNFTYKEWESHYTKIQKEIEQIAEVDPRIVTNWAIVGAGYELTSKLYNHPVPDAWWGVQAGVTGEMTEESDPAERFLAHVYSFAVQGLYHNALRMERIFDEKYDDNKADECYLIFHVGMMLDYVRSVEGRLDNLVTMTRSDLGKKLTARTPYEYAGKWTTMMDDKGAKIQAMKIRYKDK